MTSQPVKIEKLQAEFKLLGNQACEAGSKLERGQAESPLTEAIRNLLESTAGHPLTISLLCLSSNAKNTMVRWASGPDFQLPADVESRSELISIHLNSNSRPSGSVQTLAKDDFRIDVNDREGWQDVNILMASSIDQLNSEAHVYQQFCTSGHVLMVAGESGQTISDSTVQQLSDLISNYEVVWPTVLGVEDNTTDEGWWNHSIFRSPAGRLAPLFLHEQANGGGGEILSNPTGPLRSTLLLEPSVRGLKGALSNLANRQDRELRSLQTRQSLLQEQAKPFNPRTTPPNDKLASQVREQFAEELATLEKGINLKSERATQPLGELTNLMRQQVSKLRLEDLDMQQSPSMIKLSINGSHLGAVNRTIEHALRQVLAADVMTIQQRLTGLTEQSAQKLVDVVGDEMAFVTPPLKESDIWRTVENLMAIGKESHIELARKGFFDVLTAGRQKVFILIMFVSLMGRMGLPDLFASGLMRTGFGLFMASVLIGSMVNAIFVWRREKESQSEKEMSKIKDSLFSDGTKVIEQVEKGKLSYLRDYLRDFSKKFEKQLKLSAEEHTMRCKADLEAQAKRQDLNRKLFDTQIKEINEAGKQIDKLKGQAQKLHEATINLIHEATEQHETISPLDPEAVLLPQTTHATEDVAVVVQPTGIAAITDIGTAITTSEKVTDPEQVKTSDSSADERPAHRPSALLQRREARRLARQAQQSNIATD